MTMELLYNRLKKIIKGADVLKKLHQKRQRWLLRRNTKNMRRRKKRSDRKRRENQKNIARKSSGLKSKDNGVIVKAPVVCDIINNTAVALQFFDSVNKRIRSAKLDGCIYFDFFSTESISVDFIMYLIAIIKNTKRLAALRIVCEGNFPKNQDARKVFEMSGFYNYVSSSKPVSNSFDENKRVSITRGDLADPQLVGSICDFVHTATGTGRLDTKRLFRLLIEMMTNVAQHAYKDLTRMSSSWYIFVSDTPDGVRFVFLDTGLGIPQTIRMNWIEKITSLFDKSDAHFIASALKGDFRTETESFHRGKGLPEIYSCAQDGQFKRFNVVSGRGLCEVLDNGDVDERKLASALNGTLYSWVLQKDYVEVIEHE